MRSRHTSPSTVWTSNKRWSKPSDSMMYSTYKTSSTVKQDKIKKDWIYYQHYQTQQKEKALKWNNSMTPSPPDPKGSMMPATSSTTYSSIPPRASQIYLSDDSSGHHQVCWRSSTSTNPATSTHPPSIMVRITISLHQ
eukprot:2687377-Amphidinium_carterae.1